MNLKKIIIEKPWGFEYAVFKNKFNKFVGILHINKGEETSFHCHMKKKTTLFILKGKVEITTNKGKKILNEKDGNIIFKPQEFHSTKAITNAIIMEMETSGNRDDLIRIKDKYGRENEPYGKEMISIDDIIENDLKKKEKAYNNRRCCTP